VSNGGVMTWDTFTGEKPFTADENLSDLVLAIRNRCDAFLYLYRMGPDARHILPTILEDLYEDAQQVVEYCVHEG